MNDDLPLIFKDEVITTAALREQFDVPSWGLDRIDQRMESISTVVVVWGYKCIY